MKVLMKGHTWKKHSHKMTYPCVVEVKVDEIRCKVQVLKDYMADTANVYGVEFLSFANKPLHNLEQFNELFNVLALEHGTCVFDCGVIVNNNFNDTYRYVRSKKVPEDLKDAKVQFILFDLPEHGGLFFERQDEMDLICHFNDTLVRPMSTLCYSPSEVEDAFNEAIAQGYEGCMVKAAEHLYHYGKRSYEWLKMKPEEDEDGVIVECIRAVSIHGVPLDRVGSVRIRVLSEGCAHSQKGQSNCSETCNGEGVCTSSGSSFATPHGIPHALGADMYRNPEKYIGQWATFKYMERDRQGGYRHPTFVRIREDKE